MVLITLLYFLGDRWMCDEFYICDPLHSSVTEARAMVINHQVIKPIFCSINIESLQIWETVYGCSSFYKRK